jgi:hypothetical protein
MQIRFIYETKYGTFSDALNLSDEQTYTDEEIESMKEQRRDNWLALIESASLEVSSEQPLIEDVPAEEPPVQ